MTIAIRRGRKAAPRKRIFHVNDPGIGGKIGAIGLRRRGEEPGSYDRQLRRNRRSGIFRDGAFGAAREREKCVSPETRHVPCRALFSRATEREREREREREAKESRKR